MGTMQDGSFSKLVRFPLFLRSLPRFRRPIGRSGIASGGKKYPAAVLSTTRNAGKKWHSLSFWDKFFRFWGE
jgi:hypothetical protein